MCTDSKRDADLLWLRDSDIRVTSTSSSIRREALSLAEDADAQEPLPGGFEEAFLPVIQLVRMHRLSVLAGEQPAVILPEVFRLPSFFSLLRPKLSENSEDGGGMFKSPGALVGSWRCQCIRPGQRDRDRSCGCR